MSEVVASPASDDLDALARILFAPGRVRVVRSGHGRIDAPTRRALTHAVVSLRRTNVLVPVDSTPAAARALTRRSAFTSQTTAGLSAALAVVVRLGAARAGARAGLVVSDDTTANFGALAREVLGRDDLVYAAGVGVPRPNRKPVVQVLARSGDVVAFAKVGVSPLTNALVEHEAAVLDQLATRALPFAVPRLLGRGTIEGHPVVFQQALPTFSLREGRLSDPPLVVADAIAALGSTEADAVATEQSCEQWWAGVAPHIEPGARDRLAGLLSRDPVEFAASHGDFTPWNLARHAGRFAVWDWERFRPAAPAGIDIVHYGFQARRAGLGDRAALEAAAAVLASVRRDGAGCAPDVSVALYLADLLTRFGDERLQGDAEADALRRALGAALDDWLARPSLR